MTTLTSPQYDQEELGVGGIFTVAVEEKNEKHLECGDNTKST